MLFEGQAGRFVQKAMGNLVASFTGNQALRVAQTEAEGDEMTRAGLRYHMSGAAATGIAPVQALPSTAAQWLIFNPPGNTVSAFLDKLGSYLVSGTAGAGGTLLAAIVPPSFLPTAVQKVSASGVVIQNANPASTRASQIVVTSGVTLLNITGGSWFPIAWMNPAQTVVGQTQMESAPLQGRIVLPPNTGLALAVLSPTGTTPLFAPYGSWREYATDVE
jgi:hypothetical protein